MSDTPTVSYFEKRTVNIGDYESVEFCLTISGVSVVNKNFGNKTVTMTAGQKAKVNEGDDMNKVIEDTVKKVKTTLNQIENKVRTQVAGWAGMNFDTEGKGVSRGVIKKEDYKGHFGKRMNLGEDDE